MGAGFSRNAVDQRDEYLLTAGDLSRELSRELGEEENLPLDLVTDLYLEDHDTQDLIDFLKNRFLVSSTLPFQDVVSNLPWRRIFTTNYDNVIEQGVRKSGRAPVSATLSDTPADVLTPGLIVHLNGFAERLTRSSWDRDMVLTSTDYASDKVAQSDWAQIIRADFSQADSIIFFGYSVYDLDIARILFENPDIIRKTFFIIGNSPTRSTSIRVSRFGASIPQDVSDFVNGIPAPDDPRVIKPSPFWSTFSPLLATPAPAAPDTQVVEAFLAKGDLREGYLVRSVIEALPDYYVPREGSAGILDKADKKPLRIIFHSDLGNGKTCLLWELSTTFSVAGYNTLQFTGQLDGIGRDIEMLQAMAPNELRRTLFMFEDGLLYGDIIANLTANFPSVSLIVTARSAAIETRLRSVRETLGEDYELFDMNGLTEGEFEAFDRLLMEHGLWGERQGWSAARRHKYFERECKGQLSILLMSVCRSSQIFLKFESLLSSLDTVSATARKGVIAVLALAYAGKAFTLSQISEILQSDLFKLSSTQDNELFREFVHFERNVVTVKSPVFSEVVLRDLIPDTTIVDFLPDIVARLDRLSREEDIYSLTLRRMMRFGYIEKILSDNQKSEKLVSYYENIRQLGIGTRNAQFWLQYAIARMSFRDYRGAEGNFKSAFGLAESAHNYDPYQIENHYARFLLESRTETEEWEDYFEAFSEADRIVRSQMRNFREGHYPFRVATKYLSFIEARNSSLSSEQLGQVKEACEALLAIAETRSDVKERSIYRRDFVVAMKAAIDLIAEVS